MYTGNLKVLACRRRFYMQYWKVGEDVSQLLKFAPKKFLNVKRKTFESNKNK